MPRAMRVDETGGPEVLKWVDVEVGDPGPGEVRLKHTAVGLNFVDVYFRSGLYKVAGGTPFIPGSEGAGVVEAVGEGVSEFQPGDRVVYQTNAGSYAETRLIGADRLVKIPDGIDDKVAAAAFLKGITAECLLHRTFPVKPEHTILFHAAAGGVGSIACQWASAMGATVIGTVGSQAKVAAAKANGCAHVINYSSEDFVARVREVTGGAGVDVVYDSIGKDAFPGNLDCLKPLGLWCAFGYSSGIPPEFSIALLAQKGSLFATRMSVFAYLATRPDYVAAAERLFAAMQDGKVKVTISQTFPLTEAAEAHRALEGRKTVGPTVLIP